MVLILFFCILTFFIIGMPIAFAMGVGSFIFVMFDPNIPMVVCAQRVFSALDSWPIMASLSHVPNTSGPTSSRS